MTRGQWMSVGFTLIAILGLLALIIGTAPDAFK
jgi:hypothetical protein